VQDQALRDAIGMCIDREAFAEVVYNGYATASYGVYPASLPYGSTDGFELKVTGYDPEGAAALLAENGYEDTDGDGILEKDGQAVSLKLITYSYNNQCIQLADMLQAELAGIGVDVHIETMDVLDDTVAADDFDFAVMNYAQYSPSAIVMNPITVNAIMSEKDTIGRNLGLVTGTNGVKYINGIPVIELTSIPADKYLVGDFRNAANLIDYTSLSIEWAEDVNTKLKNYVVLIAQEEVIFPVYMPWAFAYGSIASVKTAITAE
jgi:ABC-type transport system substrate-binding protein